MLTLLINSIIKFTYLIFHFVKILFGTSFAILIFVLLSDYAELYFMNLTNILIGVILIYPSFNYFCLNTKENRLFTFACFTLISVISLFLFRIIFTLNYAQPISVGCHSQSLALFAIAFAIFFAIIGNKIEARAPSLKKRKIPTFIKTIVIKISILLNAVKDILVFIHQSLFNLTVYSCLMKLCYNVLEFWEYCLVYYHIPKYRLYRNIMRLCYYLPGWLAVGELLFTQQLYYFKFALIFCLLYSLILKICIFWAYDFADYMFPPKLLIK